jgi:peptidoglycan biosynthesis protein MviN/MurJ (putative lipid II flippase)
VRIAAYSLGLAIALNVIFLRWLYPFVRNGGPALATVVAAYFNFFSLFAIFRLRFGQLGTLDVLLSLVRSGVCAAMMGSVCWLGLRLSGFDGYAGFLPRLGIFAVLIAGAAVTYLVLAWAMRCGEMGEIYGIAMHAEPQAAALGGLSQEL